MIRCLRDYVKITDFQYLAMLVLCEVLSLADHEFVEHAQMQFFAINKSMTGEINFIEFH